MGAHETPAVNDKPQKTIKRQDVAAAKGEADRRRGFLLQKLHFIGKKWQEQREAYKYQMERVIDDLQSRPNFKEGLRTACRTNRIPLAVLNGLTVSKMRMFSKRTTRHYQQNPIKATNTWFQNELRLFHWTLLTQSFIFDAPLAHYSQQQWTSLKAIFFPKPIEMLQFQAQKLISSSPTELHKPWTQEQCLLLRQIMTNLSLLNRWNEVSRCLYERSGRILYRSGKQCREQWFNHLDSSKKHGEWTAQEDKIVLEFVSQHGHRWAQLCREALPTRTEHMIKNRFKSLLLRHPHLKGMSQRKIIRKLLAGKQKAIEGAFKIVNLKTYHSDRIEGENEWGESMVEGAPPAANSIQIINNSPPERQNYSQQPPPSPHPAPHRPLQEGTNNDNLLALPQINTLSSFCQITENQAALPIQQWPTECPISPFLATYYTLYPTGLLFTSFFQLNS